MSAGANDFPGLKSGKFGWMGYPDIDGGRDPLGDGPGLALEACLARAGDGRVVGLGHSQTMLDQAPARNAEANREGRLELRLGSLEDPPAAGGSFDKVCSANVVRFVPDRAAAFRKIYSVLKPKGAAATTYMPRNKNPSRADALNMAEEVSQHMEAGDFVVEIVKGCLDGPPMVFRFEAV